jgi:4-hydroxythreonine-4-phosphate dehydrogenase
VTLRLAVSVGCPCGIGPEVSVKAAFDASSPGGADRADGSEAPAARVLLVSAFEAVYRAAKKGDRRRLIPLQSPDEAWTLPEGEVGVWSPSLDKRVGRPGQPTARDGALQLEWVNTACDLVSSGRADAMVTGPVSKEVIAGSGAKGAADFLGHTEHLQRRLRAREVVMAFWSERFTTALVTTHLPLAKVPHAITPEAVARATYWLAWLCIALKARGRRIPEIAVCSLNPHAGEGGLLGGEEARAILPGIEAARARLARPRAAKIEGPIGAETAFRRAASGVSYAGVVAMYHDQATIPMKLVGFGEAVNVSLGLPIVRTSVDHGTGYDIAGKGIADARGMREALVLAARLARVRTRS